MNVILRIAAAIVLLFAGFAAGVPVGTSIGFDHGSEWALVQADLLAREVGVSMPVQYEDGQLRVIIRQPQNLHRRAWRLSEREYEAQKASEKGSRTLVETARLAGRLQPVP